MYLTDLIPRLTAYSDSTQQTWYFAIWDDRVPYFFPRSTSTIDWKITRDMINRLNIKASTKNLWNKAYAEFLVAGNRDRTGEVTDAASVTRYGITRVKPIVSLGEVAQAAAEAQSDWFLEEHKDIWPRTNKFTIGNYITDANGVVYPSSHIRAGEVLSVIDLIPQSSDLDATVRDALRTFYITQTDYDYERGTMTIIPDTESENIISILQKEFALNRKRSVIS